MCACSVFAPLKVPAVLGRKGKPVRFCAQNGERLWRTLMALGVVLTGVVGVKSSSAQCEYSVTVVTGPPCFPDSSRSVHFFGINDYGQACGEIAICGAVGQARPIVWTQESGIITLSLPEGATQGVANDINNVLGSDGIGQVACTLVFTSLSGNRAALYDDGNWTILHPVGSGLTEGFAINDAGWIAGYRDTPEGRKAVRWRGDELDELDTPGQFAHAYDINEFGVAAGTIGYADAFLWAGSSLDVLPALRDTIENEAFGINANEDATGASILSLPGGLLTRRSWIFADRRLVDLGVLPGFQFSFAEDLNNVRQVVGRSFNPFGGADAFLWMEGELHNLEDLIEFPPGFAGLSMVTAINNRGQIAAWAPPTTSGTSRGIILTPIDRPLGDVNIDCKVDAHDLMLVLGNWGECSGLGACLGDFVTSATFQSPPDGIVDAADLAVVLGNWSPPS